MLQPFEHSSDLDRAFLKAVKQIVKVTAHRERYGLSDVILLSKDSPLVIPERLTMYRWQAFDTTKFPAEIKQLAAKRREQRKLFSRMFTNAFQSLPESERIKLLYDENGSFAATPDTKKRYVSHYTDSTFDSQRNSETKNRNLFNAFKEEQYTSIPQVKKSRKRLCSSFDTLFYVGLNNTFDLKQRFLDELSPIAKRKRGIRKDIDIGKMWLASTKTRGSGSHHSQLYKNMELLRMKLLQFHEDVRPAYYGTWSKAYNGKSTVNGRRPFAKDTQILNYDYDSEAEWDYDVDDEDIHTLDLDEDNDMLLLESTDEDDEEDKDISMDNDENDEETKWVVPEGYLSDDEGIHSKKKYPSVNRNHKRITSRPVKWPISANKHFPMKSVILGPSFQTTGEPDNHPLSDFKIHMLVTLPPNVLEYSPMKLLDDPEQLEDSDAAAKLTTFDSNSLPVHIESTSSKMPLFQREIDKIVNSYKQELIDVILENKTKTMMGLVTVIKSKKKFSEYTTAQIQTMIHDIAIQEIRGDKTEYNWYLRPSPTLNV